MVNIREAHGVTIAKSEEIRVVFAMPFQVIRSSVAAEFMLRSWKMAAYNVKPAHPAPSIESICMVPGSEAAESGQMGDM